MKYGFVKVAAAIPLVKVADCQFNAQQTSKLIVEADSKGVQVIIFPELNLTGYSCGDLFGQTLLLEQAEIALMQVMNETRQLDIISIVGMPVVVNSTLMNCAVVCSVEKYWELFLKHICLTIKNFTSSVGLLHQRHMQMMRWFVYVGSMFLSVPI